MPDQDGASRSTRFKPGAPSPNPRGRPRKQKEAPLVSAFDVLRDRTISSASHELSVREAVGRKTYENALNGKKMAIRTVFKWVLERERERARLSPRPPRFDIVCEFPNPASVNDAMILLGIASSAEDRSRTGARKYLQLESWAINAALQRRTLKYLSQRRIDEVEECAKEPEEISWPSKFSR